MCSRPNHRHHLRGRQFFVFSWGDAAGLGVAFDIRNFVMREELYFLLLLADEFAEDSGFGVVKSGGVGGRGGLDFGGDDVLGGLLGVSVGSLLKLDGTTEGDDDAAGKRIPVPGGVLFSLVPWKGFGGRG